MWQVAALLQWCLATLDSSMFFFFVVVSISYFVVMYPRTAYYIFLSFFRDTIARNLCHSTCSSSSQQQHHRCFALHLHQAFAADTFTGRATVITTTTMGISSISLAQKVHSAWILFSFYLPCIFMIAMQMHCAKKLAGN